MIQVQALSVRYGAYLALREVTLSVASGEVLAVIGPNGAGKSTLIRAACGVLPVGTGRVLIDDVNIHHLSPAQRARRVAVVPQAALLPPAFTVQQTVLMGRTPFLNWLGQSGQADQRQVQLALDRTQMTSFVDRRVSELSGGEQQRVLLARALAQSTPALLLDEPTAHLDLNHQTTFLNLVRDLAQQEKLAVIITLHDLNLAGEYADRVAVLSEGVLCSLGRPAEVLTPELLSRIYQIPVRVIPNPINGVPLILPGGHS